MNDVVFQVQGFWAWVIALVIIVLVGVMFGTLIYFLWNRIFPEKKIKYWHAWVIGFLILLIFSKFSIK